jgi:hypothetical protein
MFRQLRSPCERRYETSFGFAIGIVSPFVPNAGVEELQELSTSEGDGDVDQEDEDVQGVIIVRTSLALGFGWKHFHLLSSSHASSHGLCGGIAGAVEFRVR